MMPFDKSFDPVFSTIQSAIREHALTCRRADDIWENSAIIQDVVSLIDKSLIVICDCSKRNSNVFYEIGIAHTLGRNVLLISQSKDDIPFDLQHIRFIHYSNSEEGLRDLASRIQERVGNIV
jgi:hypothetical protein